MRSEIARMAAAVTLGACLSITGACGILAVSAVAPAELGCVESAYAAAAPKDGYYFTSLVKKNEFGDVYVKKLTVTGSKLTTYGSFRYAKAAANLWGSKVTKVPVQKRSFKLTSKTKYYSTGGDQGTQRVDKSYVKNLGYTGLGLTIKVKNGVVSRVTIGS